MTTSHPQTPHGNNSRFILLAEDDIDDQEFLTEALHRLDASLNIHVEASGEKAIEWLQNAAPDLLPALIILDYNLPKVNGQQILDFLQGEKRYDAIVRLVWSTSDSPQYQQACLDAGAEIYLVKPTDLAGIDQIAKTLLDYCK